MKNIKVEIWSDIICPFCYIGKINFEKALAQFEYKDNVEVILKSYSLSPELPTDPTYTYQEYMEVKKNLPKEKVTEMLDNVSQYAQQVGLNFDLDQAKMSNTFRAHCLMQLAHIEGKSLKIQERLFKAFFTEGKNISDINVLVEIGMCEDMDEMKIRNAIFNEEIHEKVLNDINEGHSLGVQGVPFIVINRKYGISGAQPSEVFLEVLNEALVESNKIV